MRCRLFLSLLVIGAASCGRSPVVEFPAAASSNTFAVVVSGDGGWRAIDRDLTKALNEAGIPVVGLVSPRYFARRRTANESARELQTLIRRYSARWRRSRVILAGYSRGAGVLPFMISRLPAEQRDRIAVVALLGLDPAIDFKFSPGVLLWKADDELSVPVRPELRKLRGLRVLCVAGANDADAICRDLPRDLATPVIVGGGHHFGSRIRGIAAIIMAGARVRRGPLVAANRTAGIH
ncbi:MAG TPA: AcvB/VirJ family lysyl-phosphatidylglycerol hydrolase [Thermoanaerobaculia bacterium]|nr:AcvB/VirJ family lysyl-phosphatidylglycerol hydrolase [Thermoanaerobaculia bacterium]